MTDTPSQLSARSADPPPGGGETQSHNIGGFPDDYQPPPAPFQAEPDEGIAPFDPRSNFLRPIPGRGSMYVAGDEWAPVNSSPDEIEKLQRKLIEAGLIDPDHYVTPGVFDDTTRDAYKALLERSNAMGIDDGNTLAYLRSNPIQRAPAKGYVKPPRLKPDPATLSTRTRATLEGLVKRGVTTQEIAKLVPELAKLEQQAYDVTTAADQAQAVGESPTLQDVDPQSSFEELLRTKYAPEINRTAQVGDMTQGREALMSNVFALDNFVGRVGTP